MELPRECLFVNSSAEVIERAADNFLKYKHNPKIGGKNECAFIAKEYATVLLLKSNKPEEILRGFDKRGRQAVDRDFLYYKPCNVDGDDYMMIKLKATYRSSVKKEKWRVCQFINVTESSQNTLIMFLIVEEGLIWFIPETITRGKYGSDIQFDIDQKRPKRNKIFWPNYKVEPANISSVLSYYYTNAKINKGLTTVSLSTIINATSPIVEIPQGSKCIGNDNGENIDAAADEYITFGRCPTVIESNVFGYIIEEYSFILLRKLLGSQNCIRTWETACADMLYRIEDITDDLFLPIQLKTTARAHYTDNGIRLWIFGVHGKYEGMLLVLMSIEDDKIWMIPYHDIAEHYAGTAVFISENSKSSTIIEWDRYRVSAANIKYMIMSYYYMAKNGIKLRLGKEQDFDIAQSATVKVEQKNRKIIRQKLSIHTKLLFNEPYAQHLTYDYFLSISGYNRKFKIQEKTPHSIRGDTANGYTTSLMRTRLRSTEMVYTLYKDDDFDALWLSIPDSDMFYLFPMEILMKRKLITKDATGKSAIMLYPPGSLTFGMPRDEWANNYLFHYSQPNLIEALIQLLKL